MTLTTTCPDCHEHYTVQLWTYTEGGTWYIAIAQDDNELPEGYMTEHDALDAAADHLRTVTYHCIYDSPEEELPWP